MSQRIYVLWLLTAFCVPLTNFAPPGYYIPVITLIVAFSITLSIAITWRNRLQVQNSQLLPLPILIASVLALFYTAFVLQGENPLQLDKTLGAGEWVFRFIVTFSNIFLLAIFCLHPVSAYGLGAWAVAGPVLFWIVPTQIGQQNDQSLRIISIGIASSFVWGMAYNSILRKLQNAAWQPVIQRVRQSKDNRKRNAALTRLDFLFDPNKEAQTYIYKILQAQSSVQREQSLTDTLQWLQTSNELLPGSYRERLEQESTKPEVQFLLIEDDFTRGNTLEGWLRFMSLMDEIAYQTTWLVNLIWQFWRDHSPVPADTQAEVWGICQTDSDEWPLALTLLGLTAIEDQLDTELSHQLETSERTEAQFVIACTHDTPLSLEARMQALFNYLPEMVDIAVQAKFLPLLSSLAEQRQITEHVHFFTQWDRPQLLEIQARPLTSIYGSRITAWMVGETILRTDMGLLSRPVRLAFTGHGPAAVCSRVSALLHDFARERDCPSDIILAGAAFFDLTAQTTATSRVRRFSPEKVEKRVKELVYEYQVQSVLNSPYARNQLLQTVAATRRVDSDLINRELSQLANEKGFLNIRNLQEESYRRALQTLEGEEEYLDARSIPVLIPYQYQGKPLRLQIPRWYFGVDAYQQVTEEYTNSLVQQMRQEWTRRIARYREWISGFAREIHHYERDIRSHGTRLLAERTIYIHYQVDLATATQILADPPIAISALERHANLPKMILEGFVFLAWAENRLEALSLDQDIRPPGIQTTLVDAFLRGWALPSEDIVLNDAFKDWQENHRSLALAALENTLQQRNLSLDNIAIENVVFYRVEDEPDDLILHVGYIWDPHSDPVPRRENGTSRVISGFSQQERVFMPASDAQQQAVDKITQMIVEENILSSEMQWALGVDSGAALDHLLATLVKWFTKEGLTNDIQAVMEIASQKIDPVINFGFRKKLRKTSLSQLWTLIEGCEDEAKRQPIPDFWAWRLYLIGSFVVNIAHAWQQAPYDYISANVHNQAQGTTAATLAKSTPWQIVRICLDNNRLLINAIHELSTQAGFRQNIAPMIQHTFEQLMQIDSDYAEQCLVAQGIPPASPQRQMKFAPGCLTEWEQICFEIERGDQAVKLAQLLSKNIAKLDRKSIIPLVNAIRGMPIHPLFEDLNTQRDSIIEELKKYSTSASNPVTLQYAKETIRRMNGELILIANTAYQQVALQDNEYGCGWLRLIQLKWAMANYREALGILTGPKPAANLTACQLPLGLAVRRLGGTLEIETEEQQPPELKNIDVNSLLLNNQTLKLEFVRQEQQEQIESTRIATCQITGLAIRDTELLNRFFGKYSAAMLSSRGTKTFESWIQLIQIPNLGDRSIIAGVLDDNTEFAFLAASVYLGMPNTLYFEDIQPPPVSIHVGQQKREIETGLMQNARSGECPSPGDGRFQK